MGGFNVPGTRTYPGLYQPKIGHSTKKLSQHIVDSLCELYISGKSSTQIACTLRISHRSVLNYLKKNGINTRSVSEGTRMAMSRPDVRERFIEAMTPVWRRTAFFSPTKIELKMKEWFDSTSLNKKYEVHRQLGR